MNLFVDGGASDGRMTDRFLQGRDISAWSVYFFEPTLRHAPVLFGKVLNNSNFHLITKAIWVDDDSLVFNDYGGNYESNNLLAEENNSLDYIGQPRLAEYHVDCIDFLRWSRETVVGFDYKVLKLDIEGVEFFILEKMIDENMITMFDEYWIEFHARFDRKLYLPIQDDILKEFKKHNRKFKRIW